MALKFIIGSSGSGKSEYIYKKIIDESMGDMRKRFLVIVPEQFTLSTQRRLVSLHPAHSVLNIDILAFDRLAYRVFDEFCESGLTLLDDTAKNLILRRVGELVYQDLTVLKNKIRTPGYIDQVKSLFSEFEQYDMDAEDILALSKVQGVSCAFKNKVHDLFVIYEKYMELIETDYTTGLKRYERLAELLPYSKVIRGSTVVFDGYTGFTPIQNIVLKQILTLADKVYVTVTMDVRESIYGGREHELFYMSKKMIKSLSDIAGEQEVVIDDPVYIDRDDKNRFVKNGRIDHLERNIFSNTRANDGLKRFEGDAKDEIRIFTLSDPKEELMFVSSMIRRMVIKSSEGDEPLSYSDFAVVSGSPETYLPYVEDVFASYDIPYFADENTDILFEPCLEFLMSAMAVLDHDFRYDDVISFLRSGLGKVDTDEADLFDLYIFRTGIRGKSKYSKTFMIRPKEFSDDELSRIDGIRSILYEKFLPLIEACGKKTDVKTKTAAFRSFIESFDIKEGSDKDIYETVIGLFDKMDALLGDIAIDGREFFSLFESGLEAISVGSIPADFDRVLFGDIERTRLSGIKKLFLIGANDGIIPGDSSSPNIFSQNERMILKEADVALAPTVRERSFMQRFYLYELLTQGSEGLYITYARLDKDGASLRPSYIIGEIKKLFPGLSEEAFDRSINPRFWISSADEAKTTFIMLLRRFLDMRELDGERAAVFGTLYNEILSSDEKWLMSVLDAAFFEHVNNNLAKETAHALNGDEMRISVSRLEKYASCAYAYFLNYGLGLTERREHEFQNSDMGSLYHEALKIYSDMIHEDKKTWHSVTKDEQEVYLDRAVTKAYDAVARTEIMESARDRYVIEGIKRTLKKTTWAIHKQVASGEFEPQQFEVSLSRIGTPEELSFALSDGSTLNMTGVIDRIDICEKGDRVLVKIIDYKSSDRSMDYLSMYYGLQIQLVFYMNAAVDGMQKKMTDKSVVPAAMFYYHIDDPIVDASVNESDAAIEGMQIDKLRPSGKINSDMGIVSALDTGVYEAVSTQTSYRSDVAKIEVNKGGTLSSRGDLVSAEDIKVMRDYVKSVVKKTGEDMVKGRIDIAPYKKGKMTGCTYCPYHEVCGFDTDLPGYDFNRLKRIGDDSEIIDAMKEGIKE